MAPSPEPLVQFSDRLFFTTFPHPPPSSNLLNSPKTNLHPKVRSKTRYHGQGVVQDELATYYWFTIDDDLPYMSFFEDWGPLNLGQVYKACILIHELLEDKELKPHRLVLYSSNDPRRKANAALLMALFVQIVQRRQPWEAFHPIAEMEFMPFRDAGRGRSDFSLGIQDCLFGFWKATQFGLCDLNEFSLEEYEYYEKVENGDWNWITPHFIAFASPVDTVWMKNGGPSQQAAQLSQPSQSQGGRSQSQGRAASSQLSSSSGSTSSLQKKLPTPFLNCLEYFSDRSVKTIVRLNNPLYDKNTFIERGMEHVELYFDDGTNPTDEIVRKFLDLSDRAIEAGGVVAVHCKTGLGRTGTLIGAYLIYKYGFTANEAIAFMRIVRPGCVVGPQQQYMYTRQLEWAKWAAIDEYKRNEETTRAVSRMGAITPPSDVDIPQPSTPKAGQKRPRVGPQPPVTPPPKHREREKEREPAVTVPVGPNGPLEVTQPQHPPGQPRKTPRTQRVMTEVEMRDETDENDGGEGGGPLEKPLDLTAGAGSGDEKMVDSEAEEAKDEVPGMAPTGPPASPVKGGATRARATASKTTTRQPPATDRIVRTTRASARTATAANSARTAASGGVGSQAAALKARGAAATAKAKAASGTGAGAATTGATNGTTATATNNATSYKIPRLATNTTTASASASRMRPPSALGTRRTARPVSPSPGSPQPLPASRLPVPATSLIPSKRGYANSPHLTNVHSLSDSNAAGLLQIPSNAAAKNKKKGRRGSAGSIGSVSTQGTGAGGGGGPNGTPTGEKKDLDPDAWMSAEAAGAVVDANSAKSGRPLLRSVRKRRSSFSNADVII